MEHAENEDHGTLRSNDCSVPMQLQEVQFARRQQSDLKIRVCFYIDYYLRVYAYEMKTFALP